MSDNSEANIATADALTLLLHNQHALAAALELAKVVLWSKALGISSAFYLVAVMGDLMDGISASCERTKC